MKLVAAAVLLASLSPAHAGPKSKVTAQALSGVGVGVSSGLFLAAFMVGEKDGYVNRPLLYTGIGTSIITPSLGEIYAGEYVTFGMALRVGAGALATYAVTIEDHTVRCDTVQFKECKTLGGTATVMIGLAALAFVGGAAYDVMDADDAVDRSNRRHARMNVTPILTPGGASLMLGGQF